MIKITAENIRKAAEEKGFKIITNKFNDIQNGIICRCPLNCLVSTKYKYYSGNNALAVELGMSPDWVRGFVDGVDGLDESYVDKCGPIEVEGYMLGKQIRKELEL